MYNNYTNVAAKESNKRFEKQLFPKYSTWLQKANPKCPSILKSQKPDFQLYIIFLIYILFITTFIVSLYKNQFLLPPRKKTDFRRNMEKHKVKK